MLKADGVIPMDYNAFLKLCESNVSAATYQALTDFTESSAAGPLLKEWNEFYSVLQDELTYQRSVKLGRPCPVPYNRDSEVVGTVTAAMSAPNPLVSEQILLALEFKKLDSMLGIHYFDDFSLFGYAIKLKLLSRQLIFDHDEGQEEFETVFTGVQQQILSI